MREVRMRGLIRHGMLLAAVLPAVGYAGDGDGLTIYPAAVRISADGQRPQLVVMGMHDGNLTDLTRAASFTSETPQIVTVDAAGIVRPVAPGAGTVVVAASGLQGRVPVEVGAINPRWVDFERDVQPILTRMG